MRSKRFLAVFLILGLVAALLPLSAAAKPGPLPHLTGDANAQRVPGVGGTGTLWENGEFDSVNGLASELNTAVSDARTADDFVLDPACQLYDIDVVRGQLIQSSNPPSAQLEIYEDSGGNGPGALINTYAMSSFLQIGEAFGVPVYEYAFDTSGLQLAAGTYWVSVIGLGDGSFGDRAYFATAGNGVVQLQEGYFLSGYFGYTTWTPSDWVYGYVSDYAFDVDGACADAGQLQWLHVHDVQMAGFSEDPYEVRARVQIWDQDGNAVPGATVFVEILRPMGFTAGQRLTNAAGWAVFRQRSRWAGYWQICVINVAKDGYLYAPWDNEAWCAELYWPPQQP